MTHNPDVESRRGKQIPVDLTQPLVLTIDSPTGDVSVRAVDRPDVLIGYGSPGQAEDFDDDAAEPAIEVRDNLIEIRPHRHGDVGWSGIAGAIDLETVVGQITEAFRKAGPFLSRKPGQARVGFGDVWPDIAIEVPRLIAGRIEVDSACGDIHVEGFTGEIVLNTMSGDLYAIRTGGSLVVQAASGNLIAEGVRGRLTVRAASGDVRVTSGQIDEFEIQSASGDVLIDAMLASDGPFRTQTASGDVRLTVRRPATEGEAPAATLAFHSVSGDAHVDPPFRRIDRRRWQSGTGTPGPHIDITTVSGDLNAAIAATESTVVSAPAPVLRPDEAPPPPAPAAPSDPSRGERELAVADTPPETVQPSASDNPPRRAVLEAVERGEIDVEEALRRLEGPDAIANP